MSVAIQRSVRPSAPSAAFPRVKAIAEELEIRYLYGVAHGDEDIAKQALNVLSWDLSVRRTRSRSK